MAEHALVQLARRTIERYIREHEVLAEPAELTPEMRERAGAFVSLHRGGQLRGCIGTIEPTRPNAAQEIIRNAISAAVHDPRFAPLRADELDSLEISVDLLGAAEPIESLDQLSHQLKEEISHFFAVYKQPEGKIVEVDGWYPLESALEVLELSRERFHSGTSA